MQASPTRWKVGDEIQGRWLVERVLSGGMGVVYIVYDNQFQEVFAAKTFQARTEGAQAEQFRKEALVWIHLDRHPHVVQARMVHPIEDQPYLFLEYVGGGDLSSRIGTPQLVEDLPRIVRLAVQFCDGLGHVLSKGITAHRDIKPQNCLLSNDDVLKITDFGLTKFIGDAGDADLAERAGEPAGGTPAPQPRDESFQLTRSGLAAGTCTHMAPEQFDDFKRVDVRADVYSFGVMLFQMVTGRLPFEGRSWMELQRLHQEAPLPRFKADHPLSEMVSRCLAKSPADRFDGFVELRSKLANVYLGLTGQPVADVAGEINLTGVDLHNKAVNLAQLGRTNEALRAYDVALGAQVTDLAKAECLYNKGVALAQGGRLEDAAFSYGEALQLDPRHGKAWSNLGSAAGQLRQFDDALECCNRAIELQPLDERAWANKGSTLLFGFDDRPGAIRCFEEARRLGHSGAADLIRRVREMPSSPEHDREELAQALRASEAQRWDEADALFEKALTVEPGNASIWHSRAAMLVQSGQAERALPCFDRALELAPDDAKAWFGKGRALGSLRRHAEELFCYDRAISIDDKDAGGWFGRGICLMVQGDLPGARRNFEQAARLGHPQAPGLLTELDKAMKPPLDETRDAPAGPPATADFVPSTASHAATAGDLESRTSRTCPKCQTVFTSVRDQGQCPTCGHYFYASEHQPDLNTPATPVTNYGCILAVLLLGLGSLIYLIYGFVSR